MMPADIPNQVEAHRMLIQVATGRATTDYPSGRQIFAQGDDADFVFFIQNGSVKLTTISSDGAEDLIGTAHEGQFFGEACLHSVPVRLATATAIGDCRITSVTKAAMLSALQAQPRFARMFIGYLAAHNSWLKKELLDHLLLTGEMT